MSDLVIQLTLFLLLLLMAVALGLITYGIIHVYYLMKGRRHRRRRTGRKIFVHRSTYPFKKSSRNKSNLTKWNPMPTIPVNQTGWEPKQAVIHIDYNGESLEKYPILLSPASFLQDNRKSGKVESSTALEIEQDYFNKESVKTPLL